MYKKNWRKEMKGLASVRVFFTSKDPIMLSHIKPSKSERTLALFFVFSEKHTNEVLGGNDDRMMEIWKRIIWNKSKFIRGKSCEYYYILSKAFWTSIFLNRNWANN